jgi:hypothetical protein
MPPIQPSVVAALQLTAAERVDETNDEGTALPVYSTDSNSCS